MASSRVYRTPAFPADSGPEFRNGVLALRSDLTPGDLLAALHRVEALYRRRRDRRWGARTLDLDLLACGEAVLPDAATEAAWRTMPAAEAARRTPPTLILPHPRLAERAFVLAPLAEIAPGWRHPVTGRSVREMLAALDPADRAAVRPLPARPVVLRQADLGGGGGGDGTAALDIVRVAGEPGVRLRRFGADGARLAETRHGCLAEALARGAGEFGVGDSAWRRPAPATPG